jgi:hypothetical protein
LVPKFVKEKGEGKPLLVRFVYYLLPIPLDEELFTSFDFQFLSQLLRDGGDQAS